MEKPKAASRPESGTPMTTSAWTGLSKARKAPARWRASWTLAPSTTESGRAKYTYSKTQTWPFPLQWVRMERIPALSTTTISPGSTSRRYLAPKLSRAQVSEAKMMAPSFSPMHRGRNPSGSRTAISLVALIITME